MGFGGSSNTTTQEIDPDVKSRNLDLYRQSQEYLQQTPWQQYPFQQVAGFQPLQLAAQGLLTDAIFGPGTYQNYGMGFQSPQLGQFSQGWTPDMYAPYSGQVTREGYTQGTGDPGTGRTAKPRTAATTTTGTGGGGLPIITSKSVTEPTIAEKNLSVTDPYSRTALLSAGPTAAAGDPVPDFYGQYSDPWERLRAMEAYYGPGGLATRDPNDQGPADNPYYDDHQAYLDRLAAGGDVNNPQPNRDYYGGGGGGFPWDPGFPMEPPTDGQGGGIGGNLAGGVTETSYGGGGNFSGMPQFNINNAIGLGEMNQAAGMAGVQAGSTPGMEQFYNPFIDQVLGNTISDMDRARQMAQTGNASSATMSGAFGGDRHALVESETNKNFLDSVARTSGQLRSQGFDTAAQLAQDNAYRQLQATGLLGQLGSGLQQGVYQAGNVLSQLGAQQQQLGQGMIDRNIADFYSARDYPLQGFQLQQGILQGMPVGYSTTQPGGSPWSGLLGGALTLGGAALGSPWLGSALGYGVGR